MIIQWKPTSPSSFVATHQGVELVLAENHLGEWHFTADGERVKGWFTTARAAKETAERIAQKHLAEQMAEKPVAQQRAMGTVLPRLPEKTVKTKFKKRRQLGKKELRAGFVGVNQGAIELRLAASGQLDNLKEAR